MDAVLRSNSTLEEELKDALRTKRREIAVALPASPPMPAAQLTPAQAYDDDSDHDEGDEEEDEDPHLVQ
jgi:ribosomal protein L12E/L44/L45/RPP1/RPP2